MEQLDTEQRSMSNMNKIMRNMNKKKQANSANIST